MTRIATRHSPRAGIALLALLGMVACGGSGSGGGGTGGSDGGGEEGGGPAPVTPVQAYRWEVSLATPRQSGCIRPGMPLLLSVSAYDQSGASIPNPRYAVTSDVPDAIAPDGLGGWRIRGEGAARITVTYAGETAPETTIAPVSLDVLRDGTAPQIMIHQPARGAMLTTSGDVRVQGHAADTTSPIQSLTVNGIEQIVATGLDQTIDVTPPGRWGLNVIEVIATDSCGNTASLSQSYLRSPEYRPAATAPDPNARVARGQTLRLTQAAVDDLDRSDVNDLATLIERYMQRDFSNTLAQETSGQLLADEAPGCPGVGYRLAIAAPGITSTGERVRAIQLLTGRMRQDLSFQRITVPLRFTLITAGLFCARSELALTATLSAAVTSDSISVAVVSNSGRIQVNMPAISVGLTNVQLTLTGNSVADGILSSLLGLMTSRVEREIESVIVTEIPPVIEEFLNTPLTTTQSISGGPFDTSISVVAGIDGINVIPAATTETAYTQIHTEAAKTPYAGLGAISRPTEPANLATNPGPVTYAIDDNLTNQGLWALWHGGALEIPDITGLAGTQLQVSARLPPILMQGAQPDSVAFGLGDLGVTLRLDPAPDTLPPLTGRVEVEAFVSYLLDGSIDYDHGTERLHLSSRPEDRQFYMHVEAIRIGTTEVTDIATRAQIQRYAERLVARYVESLADETLVSVLLPPLRFQFDESAGGGIEALELEVTGLARTADHIVIDLAFKADVSPVPQGYLALNERWGVEDLVRMGIPLRFWSNTPHKEDPRSPANASPSITVHDYRTSTRPACDAAGEIPEGEQICQTEWKFPLSYGYYCGGGRPVTEPGGDWLNNPVLDPVDFCCRLHDRNLFDPEGGSTSPHNACGFVMCLSQASGYPADIQNLLPSVERARRRMFDMASVLCGNSAPLPAPEIVAP